MNTSLFDTLLEPTFVLNSAGQIVYMNETAATVTGVSIRKAIRSKMPLTEALEFSEPIEALANLAKLSEASAYKEVHFKNTAGDEGKIQITVQEYPNTSNEKMYLVFVRDVTLEERLQKKYRAELEQKETYIDELKAARSELEKYSKNLEQLVEERTSEIKELNRLMTMLLDSLSQGFFMFTPDGKCMDISSKACTTILDTEPKGKLVWDVLRLKPEKVAGFQKWLVTVFSEMLPFEDLAPLGPVDVPGLGKDVSLEYFPLRNGERIEAVVVVATDITNLVAAKKQAEIERERVKMILHLVQHKMEIVRFIQESDLQIKTMEDLANSRDLAMEDRESILRILHTLKGGAASFSISELVDIAHNAESDLLRLKSFDPSSIKNVSHELLQSFDKFKKEAADILGPQILNDQKLIEVPVSILESLLYMLEAQGLTSEATRIRESYLYEPVEKIFEPYQEMVERLALQLEKQVAPIEYHTNQITWSAQRHQSLAATLVHAFRNTLDHGIETPDERMAAGKSAEGHIKIFFEKNNDRYLIKIEDDGRGIDPARIRQKLDKQGFDHSAETDEQVIQHVFDSQFSTKDQVSELSGRGVGMDAIAYEAKKLGGLAYVKSKLKLGTVLIIEIPIQNKSNTSKAA